MGGCAAHEISPRDSLCYLYTTNKFFQKPAIGNYVFVAFRTLTAAVDI